MSAEDVEGECLGLLLNAILSGLPRGIKFVTPAEEKKLAKEATESRQKHVDELLYAVVHARVSSEATGQPAQLQHAQLKQLERILAGILAELELKAERRAGRPQRDHRLIVIDFLLRKRSALGVAPKRLHADVAAAWGTTPQNVKKLVTENRRSADTLLEKIGVSKAATTVQAALQYLKRYRNST